MGSLMEQFRTDLASWLVSLGAGKLSHEFFNLVNNIGSARSKQEEALIIKKESELLQATIRKPENAKTMREFLIRALYCEMLGTPVPFAYIYAINLTQSTKMLDKRVGYLCTSLFLNENHELLLLLLNSVRKDLDSTNVLDVTAALSCMTWLLNKDTVDAILPLIIDKFKSPNEFIRKKAVLLVMRCIQKDLTTFNQLENSLRAKLCDPDPSVMSATLHCFLHIIKLKYDDPIKHSNLPTLVDLVPSFVGILKQLVEKRLPASYNYNNTHAPWTQITLLKILKYLGLMDPSCVINMTQVLKLILTTPAEKMISCAIVYETIRTICALNVEKHLLDLSAKNISYFIGATSQDLNYLGLTLLAQIVAINPLYAAEHQSHVISCLETNDESIRQKTIELLFHMTNVKNLTIIVEKMMERLKKTTDAFQRTELVHKITVLAEKFSTDNYWFITTMNQVFEIAGDQVTPQIANKFIQFISEGATDDEAINVDLRLHAIHSYIDIISTDAPLSDIMQIVIAWVLGEYGYLLDKPSEAMDCLSDLLSRSSVHKQSSRSQYTAKMTNQKNGIEAETFNNFALLYGNDVKQFIVQAIAKLAAATGVFPLHVRELLNKFSKSDNLELSRRCQETIIVLDAAIHGSSSITTPIQPINLLDGVGTVGTPQRKKSSTLQEIFPLDASAEDLLPSELLKKSLESFVSQALQNGAKPYSKPLNPTFITTTKTKEDKQLRWKAYEKPVEPQRTYHHSPTTTNVVAPSTPNYNPLMTVASPGTHIAPGSPVSVQSSAGNAPHLQTTTANSLAALANRSGPWSTGGFVSNPKPQITPQTNSQSNYTPPTSTELSTSNPTQTSKPASFEPPKPQMDSKQAKLASALFSGVGDDSSLTHTNRHSGSWSSSGSSSSYRKRNTPKSPIQTNLIDQDISHHSDPSPATSTDLLGLGDFSTPTKSPSSLESRPETNQVLDLLTDLHVPLSPTSSSVMAFTDGETVVGSSIGGAVSQLNPDRDNWNLSNLARSDLLTKYDNHPRPSQSTTQIVNDAFLCVSYLKTWTEDGLNLILLFGNRTSLKLVNLTTSLTLTPPLTSSLEADRSVQVASKGSVEYHLSAQELRSHSASIVSLQIETEEKLSFNLSVHGTTTFEVHAQVKTAKFRVPVDLRDLMRPSKAVSVQQFGTMWTTEGKKEVKEKIVGCTSSTTTELAAHLQAQNFEIVQVVKNEIIAVSRMASKSTGLSLSEKTCLLHCKLESSQVEITLRSDNFNLIEVAGRSLSSSGM